MCPRRQHRLTCMTTCGQCQVDKCLNEFTTMKTVMTKVVKRILTWIEMFLKICLRFEIITRYYTQFVFVSFST